MTKFTTTKGRYGLVALAAFILAIVSYFASQSTDLIIRLPIVGILAWTGTTALSGMVTLGAIAGLCAVAALVPDLANLFSRVWLWFVNIPEPDRAKPDDNKSRWSILAGCRFWLALTVAMIHVNIVTMAKGGPSTSDYYPWLKLLPWGGGFNAVAAFLVISGFSIASSLDREPSGFYRRRFWRIIPVVASTTLLSMACCWIFGSAFQLENGLQLPSRDWQTNLMTALGLNDIVTGHTAVMMQSWSMAVEVVFYIVAPLLWRLKTKIIVVILAVSAWIYWDRLSGSEDMSVDQHLHAQSELLWIWLAGFILWRHRDAVWAKTSMVLVVSYLLAQYHYFGSPAFPTTAFILALVAYGDRIQINARAAKVLNWLGDISFPLYLVHYTVFAAMHQLGGPTLHHCLLIYPLAAIVVSIGMYYFIDKPCRQFGRRRLTRLVTVPAEG